MLGGILSLSAGCAGHDAGVEVSAASAAVRCLYWQVDGGEAPSPGAVAEAIAALAPDLVMLDLADDPDDTLQALQDADPAWVPVELERLPGERGCLVLLSGLVYLSNQTERDVSYHVGGEDRRIRYGILDVAVQLPSGAPLYVLGVSAKDKTFDPAGQTEMRRNEIRLVGRHLQRLLETTPGASVLLLGALNDDPHAAPIRALMDGLDSPLRDLRPVDERGDAWTSHDPETDLYLRHHYALFRADAVPPAGRILDTPALRTRSRHRPLWIEFAP